MSSLELKTRETLEGTTARLSRHSGLLLALSFTHFPNALRITAVERANEMERAAQEVRCLLLSLSRLLLFK